MGNLTHPFIRLSGDGTFPTGPDVRVQIVCVLGRLIVCDQARDHLPGLVELVQVVGEGRRLLVALHEGVALPHAVVLSDYSLEELFEGVSMFMQRDKQGQWGTVFTVAMLVWLASMRPLTRCAMGM